MEWTATRRLAPLTDKERNELRAKGACFRCRKTGHMSRDCPNQTTQPRACSTRTAGTRPTEAAGGSTTPAEAPAAEGEKWWEVDEDFL